MSIGLNSFIPHFDLCVFVDTNTHKEIYDQTANDELCNDYNIYDVIMQIGGEGKVKKL